MAQLGVVESENAFYQTFYEKWQEYLSRLSSGQKLISVIGHDLTGPEDVKAHMEEIRIYMRGHNMFDCFYGRFKKEENEHFKPLCSAGTARGICRYPRCNRPFCIF